LQKLHRLVEEKKIAGICAGLGEYFDLDPVFFRAAFVALALVCGLGILAYIVMWLVIPRVLREPPGSAHQDP